MSREAKQAIPIIIGLILAVACIIKIGLNFFGIIAAIIVLGIPCALDAERDKNKANSYLAEKYDEEHKRK